MKHIVIIHGLASKPAQAVLAQRYRIHLSEGVGQDISPQQLNVVYWADLMGYAPDTAATDEYNEHGEKFRPYSLLEKLVVGVRSQLRQQLKDTLESRLSAYLNPQQPDRAGILRDVAVDIFGQIVNRKAERIYERFLPDLDRYFNRGQRQPVKQRLIDVLDQTGEQTCLIAHSMGSIIALDVLLHDPRRVAQFITIGSPLGLQVIQNHIGVDTQGLAALSERLGSWHNLYDCLDVVALDHDLADDFGSIPITDTAVENLFIDKAGERNPHKSYGYLRTQKLGTMVRGYLRAP